ncbi:NAD-dependent dehydratase [Companilactobacillus crustorum]|uniref:Saccharopine dehydrogenase related protein n=3 Tax=Companilactobacillus TaxID=2767879 RepID=A0A837RJX8_9LACO|nr:NAD(P)H-binding protein [Companilactobacillus crustorum]KRK43352.1 saccharopine dehydrogenase related protein [Companilactobacillus crustorum JCM 15951]KRO20901.1 saccharopine dehydrogenase related protein [Companilactobacillus crustorum]GEO77149.1 NAD-dependent dehydratase [Companilactobacillus crustorum]
MARVLILGANGKIARLAEHIFADTTDSDLRLYLRNAERLRDFADSHTLVEAVEGDTTDVQTLIESMKDEDLVYANLAGSNIESQARAVVQAMHAEKKTRLVWISTLGIYDEVPGKFGEWNKKVLGDYITNYAAAAKVIEDSDLDYTIIRPAWLTDKPEVDYEVTKKGEDFKGTEVSRRSIAQIVVDIAQDPDKYSRESIGVNKPNTDGDKPAWY